MISFPVHTESVQMQSSRQLGAPNRWVERGFSASAAAELESAGLSPLMARILASRGVTAGGLDDYLNPRMRLLASPEELECLPAAVETVLSAVSRGMKIVVFGDYDCDGVCATAIAVTALETVGADVVPFIPHRLTEGYGMSEASLARMRREHPDVGLVVTVDNGINSVNEVAALSRDGIEVVVTDHHLPSDELPAAKAVVNPKVAATPRLADLCGAGVAFMFAKLLVVTARERGLYCGAKIAGPLTVLAGLATVTDIMPLTGQNRVLVAEALRLFSKEAPAGLKTLCEYAGKTAAYSMTSRDFGFLLGPRINAAGRLSSGMEALELILSDDGATIDEQARKVVGFNDRRKTIEREMTDAAMSSVVEGAPAQVIELPGGNPGVAGIVAARVMERLADSGAAVPVCIVVDGHGSARSPEWLNIRDAMHACSEALVRFGGHAAAGGFKVERERIGDFRRLMCEYCARAAKFAEGRIEVVDAWTTAGDLTLDLAETIKRMEPFGEGNPEPVFAMRGVTFADVRPLGSNGRHLQVTFRDRSLPRAVWWNHGDFIEKLRGTPSAEHDIRFTVEVSTYGERHLELRLQSVI
jgi:single-stranded-DNA-specific exonuclease